MPPRLNKRQLREQEELLALGAGQEEETSGEDEHPTAGGAGFAALMNEDDSDADNQDGAVSRSVKPKKAREPVPFGRKKKKKKTADVAPPPPSTEATSPPAKRTAPIEARSAASTPAEPFKKEKKKKQKAKGKKDDRDDLDKALAELSLKYPDLQQAAAAANASPAARSVSSALASLLSVSLQHLDSEAEMRKFFGSKVIAAAKSSSAGASSSRRTVAQRSNLTRPQPTWWPAQMREGLSARLLSNDELNEMYARHGWEPLVGERLWSVEYSKKYRGVTLAFMRTVMSGDPEGFWQLLKFLPYHADTLLQLSEVYFHREEHSTAADYIDRALFTYERAFVGSFNFTNGVNRLDFDQVQNRPFFLALHRQVSDLQRRGCVRAAFEFARLLYSLDPWTDPHGALLHLDYLAIKAGMSQWLLDMWDFFSSKANDSSGFGGRLRVTVLPGWVYARALALFMREEAKGDKEHTSSTNALQDAILAFPSIVPLLADRADIPLSSTIRGHGAFRIHPDASSLSTQYTAILHLLSHLYAQRSFSLWKIPENSSWFARTINATLPSLPPSYETTAPGYVGFVSLFSKPALAHSVYRHAIVLEASCRRLFGFIPRHVTNAKHLACDPLPPPTRVNEYDAEFFKGAEDALAARPRGRKASERALEQLIPDPVFRRQLQAFFEAHPDFAQRFPGGIVQFAQIAAQLPEEVLEDMMIAEAGGGPPARGGMPGGMPGEDEMLIQFMEEGEQEHRNDVHPPPLLDHGGDGGGNIDEEEEVEEEEEGSEEEDLAPLPVRLLRNVMSRFWGGNVAAESSEEEDEEDVQRPGELQHPDDEID
ncbi:uncharacterized protein FIBRA_01015 [Fibroporia radiculosa]|uniref:DUF654-domain-containing protein n=1 Tax=Fibroporia radiculosa TaxID=599839 RepID=J4HSM1_9APHY|nr:uncharacterized protein FIBRA_01015 [Fibroporia radiculosa]CCL99007.1 predicted protein [Fibroporia radiculosa]